MKKTVKNHVSWIGYLDWDLEKFHGDDYTIHYGSSQNAYIIEEEKTILMDTVWAPHRDEFIENLKKENLLHKIDAIVAQHGECDHSGSLPALLEEIPDTPVYCTANAVKSLEGQYGKRGWNFHVVKTGDTLDIGNGKKLIFVEMPMLHWPDSMATFLTGDNIFFSMDAFGQHCAVQDLFADKADETVLWSEAERYFANIVAPFSPMVTRKVKELKSLNLPIEMIAPSHGAIWRRDPMKIVDAYEKWASGETEDQVTIVYGTMWHGTEKIAHAIADEIYRQSPSTTVKIFNVDHTEKDDIVFEVFKSKAIAVGSPTILNGVLASVAGFLYYLKSLRLKGRKSAVFGCYGWSGEGNKYLRDTLKAAGYEVVNDEIKSSWNPGDTEFSKVPELVEQLLGSETGKTEEKEAPASTGEKWKCPCGYIYDSSLGDPEHGVKPGTAWKDVPADWTCPRCGLPKSAFTKIA